MCLDFFKKVYRDSQDYKRYLEKYFFAGVYILIFLIYFYGDLQNFKRVFFNRDYIGSFEKYIFKKIPLSGVLENYFKKTTTVDFFYIFLIIHIGLRFFQNVMVDSLNSFFINIFQKLSSLSRCLIF